MEALEPRLPLSGDVWAAVAGGSATIRGTAEADNLLLTQIDDEFLLVGFDTAIKDADFGFDLLGIDIEGKFLSGVTKDVRAFLNGGDDIFVMAASVNGVQEFDGLSSLEFGSAKVHGNLTVYAHAGNDIVAIAGTDIGGHLILNTGNGEFDAVALGGGGAAVGVLDVLTDIFGGYEEFVQLSTQGELGTLDIEIPSEVFDAINAVLGEVNVGGNLIVNAYGSSDSIYIGGMQVDGNASVVTRGGEDFVHMGVGAEIEVFWDDEEFGDLFDGIELPDADVEISAHVAIEGNLNLNTGTESDYARLGGTEYFYFGLPGFYPEAQGDLVTEDFNSFYFGIPGGLDVGGRASVTTGSGDDSVDVGVYDESGIIFGDSLGTTDTKELDGYPGSVNIGHDLSINTGNGYDSVLITDGYGEFVFVRTDRPAGVSVGKNLNINTGKDGDEIGIFGSSDYEPGLVSLEKGEERPFAGVDVGHDLSINTGAGENYVDIHGTAVGKSASIITGSDHDRVMIGGGEFIRGKAEPLTTKGAGMYVHKDLRINTQSGHDYVGVYETFVGGRTSVNTGSGDDYVSMDYVGAHDGLNIMTLAGYDEVSLYEVGTGGLAMISTGADGDSVYLDYVYADKMLRVRTEGGHDEVFGYGLGADALFFDLGKDDDRLCLVNSGSGRLALLNGGAGYDELGLRDNYFGKDPVIIGFEGEFDCYGP
jgi:hypothetical protein